MIILESKVDGLSPEALGRFVLRARRAVPLQAKVNILVTSRDELRRLNLRFRKKNKTTDVLSFPAESSSNGARPGALAGEIAISAEVAARNAARLGHSPAIEVKILALHGILHLAGFDHERDNGEMAGKEAHLRRKLGLPSSLTERGEWVNGKPPRSPGRSRLQTARRVG